MNAGSDRKPVVVGSGLTGLAISRELARDGIEHLLIGRPPPYGPPKLGESMNLEGSYFLQQAYPEYARFFFKKTKAVTYVGEMVAHFDADKEILPRIGRFFGLRDVVHPTLLHVDRIGFDEALFRDVTADERCSFLERKVAEFRYSADSDRVDGIVLDDGAEIEPACVFDATNHGRVLARGIGVPCEVTSARQRIVFTHYQHPDYELGSNGHSPAWECWSDSTSVCVLHRELDGIDGVSWFIPIGDYLSVGISLDDGGDELSDEEVLARVEETLIRRGMDFREIYPRRTRIASARNQYFVHERAFGANWMLCGPTFAQIWFPSSSGVGMGLFASFLASRFLRSPRKVGPRYEAAMRQFLTTHDGYCWLMDSDPRTLSKDAFGTFSDKLISEALRRTAAQCGLLAGGPRALLLRAFGAALGAAKLEPGTFMYVDRAAVEELTPRLYGAPAAGAELQPVLDRLLALLNGEVPMSRAWQCFDENLTLHVGGLSATGIGHWFTWFRLTRRFGRVADLRVDFESYFVEGDRVRVVARWRGRRGGEAVTSDPARATYRIRDGKIVELWSAPANYAFVFGKKVLFPPLALGFLVLGMLRLRIGDWLHPVPDPPWRRPAAGDR